MYDVWCSQVDLKNKKAELHTNVLIYPNLMQNDKRTDSVNDDDDSYGRDERTEWPFEKPKTGTSDYADRDRSADRTAPGDLAQL